MQEGLVFDIKKFSIHDGPGIRTTVFLKGCPLACAWCHNPEGQLPAPQLLLRPKRCIVCGSCEELCPEGAISRTESGYTTDTDICKLCGTCTEVCPAEARELVGRRMSIRQVMEEIQKDQLFYDESGGGVTFSGGEPLMQPHFLLALLEMCGELDIHRAVDTSGLVDEDLLLEVARETDLFLYDLKHIDTAKHRVYTGVSNAIILKNLIKLVASDTPVTIRFPLVGGVNDDDENVHATASMVRSLPKPCQVSLLPYHKHAQDKHWRFGMSYRLSKGGAVAEERLEEISRVFSSYGLQVRIGG